MKKSKRLSHKPLLKRRNAWLVLGSFFVLALACSLTFVFASKDDIGSLAANRLCLSSVAGADVSGSGSYTVTCRVSPVRYIIVDKYSVIIGIVSNTPQKVVPVVRLNTLSGPTLPYSDKISRQYSRLLKSVDFSRNGIVYQHRDNFTKRAIDSILH